MINIDQKIEWLDKISELLDITPSQYDEAESRYKAVSEFLGKCPKIAPHLPILFPQGSFRLGTVVRPILDGEDFDVDVICQLTNPKENFTQKSLKNLIGNRLKEPQYSSLLQKEKKRCWMLKYYENSKFHLDVIPAISDYKSKKFLYENYSLNKDYSETAISITDNTRFDYDSIVSNWPTSNPKGYALWFESRMIAILNESKIKYAQRNNVKIEDVPTFKVKTPLQKSIQILKRHRDVIFGNNEDKPISIIITTLAAKAYKGENNILTALENIVFNMENYIDYDNEGNDLILNPVDPRENFADKWKTNPIRKENFIDWLDKVKLDVELLKFKNSETDLKEFLSKILDNKIVNKSVNELSFTKYLPNLLNLTNSKNLINKSPNEEFISDLYKVEIDKNVIFRINCKVTQNGFRTKLLRELPILKKQKSLEFFVETIRNIQEPYEIKWKVRNSGPLSKGNERGEILNDYGLRKRKEFSSFYGDHYVECYLIKNGVCVAIDKLDVPISLN